MVVIDDTPDYGAAASAPTFATIARDALHAFNIPPLPKQPPAPGVPLATSESATGAGEVAGTPLPGLATPPAVTIRPAAAGQPRRRLGPPRPAPAPPDAAPSGRCRPPPTTTVAAPTTAGAARSRSSPGTG